MASWADIVTFAEATPEHYSDLANDRAVTLKVMSVLPVIVWDPSQRKRRVVPMRWGFPHPKNPAIPQPIHARAETIDTTQAFASAFANGQRGIVLVRNFNEGRELENGKTEQHTIALGAAAAAGIAFLHRSFDLGGRLEFGSGPLNACVMATVPANALIASLPTDRMPAILAADDWVTWLGETPSSPAQAKACLRTVEGVNWTMTREERATRQKRTRPTVSDPKGLF